MPAWRYGFILILILIAFLLSVAAAQDITVKPGDSLWAIASRHHTTVEALMLENGLTSSSLMPGMVLRLPGGSTAQPSTYTVRPGDTLYDIALAFNTSVDSLIVLNNLDGTLIRVGQVLRVVRSEEEPEPEPLVVTINPGDTLWALARRHDSTPEAISAANRIAVNSVLRPGDQLRIPGRYAPLNQADQGGAAPPTITVRRGDSLWQIAQRYGTTVAALMSANNLSDTNLRTGQTLRIVPGNELARALPAPTPTPTPAPTPRAGSELIWPANGAITSPFGHRRLRISGSNFHTGIDIDGNTGDPIVAARGGLVTFAGWRSGFGKLVIITAGDTEYYYAHASQLLVSVGEVVEAGQLIARIGATGIATGSHLHFEIRVNGRPLDPLPLLEGRQASN
ncbi:MAG: LysM peptidoglycan-binding domain-containing protein [Truepera sp.]|nr:LysM peptidoglycan-binding domain-containing protein [Truepera sp.]